MKTVAKYKSAFSAYIAKGMLENAGIQAAVLNENIPFTAGVTDMYNLSIELAVDDKDYLEAKRLLAASSSAE